LPKQDISLADLEQLAAESVLTRLTVTGVQKKLSLALEKNRQAVRFTIVGLWGDFILKPPSREYPELPENEDTTMRLASLFGIECVPHAMIRLRSGELAYITRRIDRDRAACKLAMEDFCQLGERLTEDKYKGSYERCGALIRRYSSRPGLDAYDFLNRLLFCFLTGNADMHLKNFSLLELGGGFVLAPAYDMVATVLIIADDAEETALTLNGKKSRIRFDDFHAMAKALGLTDAQWKRLIFLYEKMPFDRIGEVLGHSSLSLESQERYRALIAARWNRLFPQG